MNIKEYIESGILEAYVLDALPKEERLEVEAAIAQYPDLAVEVAAIEDSLINFAEAGSITPPFHLQEQIWNTISAESNTPIVDKIDVPKVVPFTPTVDRSGWQRAAVLIALIGSLLLNFLLWSQRNKSQEDQLAIQQQLDTLQKQQQYLAGMLDEYRSEGDMMADTNVQTIVMKSIQPGHPMAATIYWNKAKGETYLSMKKLPMPPEGMQYQMWVIQDGKPVSMGVLSNDMVDKDVMAQLPMEVTDGQAFAISLEKEGGSPTPTAENIYVLGKAS